MADTPRSGNGSITTSATPGVYTTLPTQECRRVTAYNVSGNTVNMRQDGGGVAIPLNNGNAYPWAGLTDANQISFNSSVASVLVYYRWEL